MNNQQTLAVIIPAYNAERYIKETIESLQNQPCNDIAIIVINDGSIDNTAKIVYSLTQNDNRIKLINQENKGVSVARNHGLEFCINHGYKYIAFLDADDVWIDNFYTKEQKSYIFSKCLDMYSFRYLIANHKLTRAKEHYGSFASNIYSLDIIKKYNIRFPQGIGINEDCVFHYIFTCYSNILDINDINDYIFIYRNNPYSTCHNKKDVIEKYFNHVIKAWYWCEKYYTDGTKINKKNIDYCRTMQRTLIAEFIVQSAINGLKISQINHAIKSSDFYSLYNDESIWIDENSKKIFTNFKSHNKLFWIKHRIVGILTTFAKKLKKIKLFENIYYPIDLNSIYFK